jgi:hypothetical protein
VNVVSNLDIQNFTASPTYIKSGQNSYLSFDYYNVKACNLNGGIYNNEVMAVSNGGQEFSGVVGSFTVNPNTTTAYNLSCSNNVGQVINKSVTINATN